MLVYDISCPVNSSVMRLEVFMLEQSKTTVKCQDCGEILSEPTNTPVDKRGSCPNCGSKARHFEVEVFERVEVHSLHARPKIWHCIYCGWHCNEPHNDYICKQCHQIRPFAGGSATMKECRNCEQWSLAIAAFCEWCGKNI